LGPRGAQRQNQYPDALAAGAALVTSGTDLPRDGVLVFYQDWIAIFFDADEPRFHNHADLESSGWDPCAGPQDVGV
jgi:hypothetical protein